VGYSTDFTGQFNFDKELDEETYQFLYKFSNTRRMKRKFPNDKYGVEGEFFVDGKGCMGQDDDKTVVDHNTPPQTQPSLWCDWEPTKDRLHIKWNGAEKFYYYVKWIQYIIDNVLEPKGYVLSGSVDWQGEDSSDTGAIIAINNLILTTEQGVYQKLLNKAGEVPLELGEFLENPENLPPLVGLDKGLDKWIERKLGK